jgi:hypothetical protein
VWHKEPPHNGNKQWVERHGIHIECCCKITREIVAGSPEVKNAIWVDYLDPKEDPEFKTQR